MTTYFDFFRTVASVQTPYPYQIRLGTEEWPEVLNIPTGLGKTAAVSVAWIWKRGWRLNGSRQIADSGTPRRLIWCLPMRVLVEQTAERVKEFLDRAKALGDPGEGHVSVHVLMGGEGDMKTWVEYPEEDMVLVGTQDMLLSRALMRGWGINRFQWPIHFSLLHNDCLWAFDEIQLMGPGLTTSAQLEGLRRTIGTAKPSRSLWLSATLDKDWLATIDFAPHMSKLICAGLKDEDREAAKERIQSVKHLSKAHASLDKNSSAKGNQLYLSNLVEEIVSSHDREGQTLVILNRVERAQQVFLRLSKLRGISRDLLLHARFRPFEREEIERRLREESSTDRIIVATQAIEAGVDLTSSVLFTELAPWSSLVQRFGRCNRYGELNPYGGAQVYWIDIKDDADPLPYNHGLLSDSRRKLDHLTEVGPAALPSVNDRRPITSTLRKKDLFDLFNTDPDLSGFDVDVSDFIRDTGFPDLQVFWRDIQGNPNEPEIQPRPQRRELCRVPVSQGKFFDHSQGWIWDSLAGSWSRLQGPLRPGMTVLLDIKAGGYDRILGFYPKSKKEVMIPALPQKPEVPRRFDDDWRSSTSTPVKLSDHLRHVSYEADRLCRAVGEKTQLENVIQAARWHDVGKAHPVFQASMHRCPEAPEGLLAKSNCPGPMRHQRRFFRHELASMLAWLANRSNEESVGNPIEVNLVAYLIAAHHGKVRMSLRSMPNEEGPDSKTRFARGVWEGDLLPPVEMDGQASKACSLSLDIMEIGGGNLGASWTERTQYLVQKFGVFHLAWLEMLVRLADWRASAKEQESSKNE